MVRRIRVIIAAMLVGLGAPAAAVDRPKSLDHYARATAALRQGRPRMARVELLNAIKADPANGAAHLMQGLVYLQLGQGVAAESEIARARATGVAIGGTRHLMAHALWLQGASQRALAEASAPDIVPRFAGLAARMRGRALVQLGDLQGAATEFARATRLSPDNPEIWVDFGRFEATRGHAAAALLAADRAVGLDRRNVEALILKGALARTQYGLLAGLTWFDRALAVDPQNVPALQERAATLGDLGRSREMLATTRAAIALDGANPVPFYLQAVLAARARNFTLARSLIRRTGGPMDDVPGVLLLSALLDVRSGNFQQAIERLARLVAMQPDNLKAQRLLGLAHWRAGDLSAVLATLRPLADRPQADSYVLTLVGRALERKGDRAAATAYLDRAAVPGPILLTPAAARALADLRQGVAAEPANRDGRIALARALLRAGQAGDALDQASAVLRADPNDADALILIGDGQFAQDRYDQAIAAYRAAANIAFTEPVAVRMIDVLRRSGQGAAAYQVLSLFLAQNPMSVAGQLLAVDLAMASGQWRPAVAILDPLRRRLGDRDAAILHTLAWAYFQTGRGEQALPLAAAARALLPANPAAADTYGWLLFRVANNRARAVALIEQAAAQAPANPAVRWHLAQLYVALGRRDAARAEARAALARPDFADRAQAAALLTRR